MASRASYARDQAIKMAKKHDRNINNVLDQMHRQAQKGREAADIINSMHA